MASTMNAKKIINNTNGKEVWKIKNNANDKIAFMKVCKVTINLGDYVYGAEYKLDNGSWTTINFVNGSQIVNFNYGQTLYIRASNYESDSNTWDYTSHNFSLTLSHSNDNESYTIYQTREKIVYTSTITAGDYVSTVRAKVNDGSWTNADSSVSIQHNYDDTVYYEAVTYDTTYESGTTKYIYEGATSSSFTNSTSRSVTLNRTRRLQYYVTITGVRCTPNKSTGWHDPNTVVTWTADTNCAFDPTGTTTTFSYTITEADTINKSANYVNCITSGTRCSANKTGWMQYGENITWTATNPYCFDSSNTQITTTSATAGNVTLSADYVLRYVLSISVTNEAYGSYSVTRTSSPYAGASTGNLATGSTIYYGDKLSIEAMEDEPSYNPSWDITYVNAPSVTSTGAATSGNMTFTNNYSGVVSIFYNTSNTTEGASTSYNLATVNSGASVTKTGLSFGTTYYVWARVLRHRTLNTYYVESSSLDNYDSSIGVNDDVTAIFEFGRYQNTEDGYIYSSSTQHTTANINTYTLTISVQNPSYASSYSVSRTSSPYGASTGVLSDGATLYYGDVLLCSATAKSQETTWDVNSLNPPIINSTKKNSSSYYTTYIEGNNGVDVYLYRNTNNGQGGTSVSFVEGYETVSASNCSYGTTYYYNFGYTTSGTIYTYSVSTGWSTKTVDSNVTATINYSISTQSTSKTIYSSNVSKSLSYVPTKDDFYIECSTEYDDGADENYYLNYLYIKNNFPSSVTIRHSVNGSADLTSSSNSYSSGQTRSFTSHWTEDTINTVTLAVTYNGSTYTFTYTGSDLHFYWR